MHPKYFHIIILFLSLFGVSTSRKKKIYEILKSDPCPEYPNALSTLTKAKFRNRRNGNNSVEISWVVKQELAELEAVTNVRKCDSAGTPESCEYIVKDLKFKKICEKIPVKNQFWSSFVEGVKPPLRCPVKAGTYAAEISVNKVFLNFFPLPTGIWKTTMEYLVQNKVISCTNIDFKVVEKEY